MAQYRVHDARRPKGAKVVKPLDSNDGYKGRVSYLCEYVRGKWSRREDGYVMSPRKVKRLEYLLDHDYRAGVFSNKLYLENGLDEVEDPTIRMKFEKLDTLQETIAIVLQDFELTTTPIGLVTIERGIQEKLSPKQLGLVIGEAVGKPGYSYRRVADLLYRELEKETNK